MRFHELNNCAILEPLTYQGRDNPHLTIEITRACNITCKACYAAARGDTKSLGEVRHEIDLARQKRNLESITLLGGEPTLHPDLVAIIGYVKQQGLVCQLLTNSISFLAPDGGRLLDAIAEAGIDRIMVHIDCGQTHVHDDVEGACDKVFTLLDDRRIHFSRCLTIYDENSRQLPDIIRHYGRFKYFDGLLGIIETASPGEVRSNAGAMAEEYAAMVSGLGVEPATFVPSSIDREFVSWLNFIFFRNVRTGATLAVDPQLFKFFRHVHRRLTGHHVFAIATAPGLQPVRAFITGLFELAVRGRPGLFRLFRNSAFGRDLRLHYVVIQSPPEYSLQHGAVQICHSCPDATIRNGMVTPVCLADRVNPIDKAAEQDDVYLTVYKHLGEFEEVEMKAHNRV